MLSDQSSRKDNQREWRGGLKEPDEISELARGHRRVESGKDIVTPLKASKAGRGRSRTFELITIGWPPCCGW
jgi:hypothetical protein